MSEVIEIDQQKPDCADCWYCQGLKTREYSCRRYPPKTHVMITHGKLGNQHLMAQPIPNCIMPVGTCGEFKPAKEGAIEESLKRISTADNLKK